MANPIRRAAVAGSWYPASAEALAAAVDGYLAAANEGPPGLASLTAIIAPHAGLMYSGPVAAYAYRQLRHRSVDVAVLVGPSHFVGFTGVAYHVGRLVAPAGASFEDVMRLRFGDSLGRIAGPDAGVDCGTSA